LVGAFLEQPLPKELYRLSRFAKVTPPWGPPPHGSGPEEYAAAWAAGYDGGPIRAAFRWIGQHGLESLIPALPKSLQSRGRAPKAPPIHEFVEIPEVERLTRYLLRHGAAMHDIQELLFAFREVWSDLDRLRPDVWGIEAPATDRQGATPAGGRAARGHAGSPRIASGPAPSPVDAATAQRTPARFPYRYSVLTAPQLVALTDVTQRS
jgi:hypothetical protein